MTAQYSVSLRNAKLDAVEATIGTSPILRIRTGAPPVNCATADSGTVLAEVTLPSNWMNDAAAGVKSKLGTWEDLSADAAGTAAHFRFYDSGDTTCHMQGTVTAAGGGGDMVVDNVVFSLAQFFSVPNFQLNAGQA